ncbi:MAG: PKD domain-containing protein [Candidatus Promineifilaceae bacterium]
MKRRLLFSAATLALLLLGITALSAGALPGLARSARGKSAALPVAQGLTPDEVRAQQLALADSRLQSHTAGRRSEVMGILRAGDHVPASAAACRQADCRMVNVYVWDDAANVAAYVNLDTEQVLDVLYQPGVQPLPNQRLVDLAIELTLNDPRVIDVLGYRPSAEEVGMYPVHAGAPGTVCEGQRFCLATLFYIKNGTEILWVFLDMEAEEVAALRTTGRQPDDPANQASLSGGCPDPGPDPGPVARDGWALDYEGTEWDGMRVYDVTYNGTPVLTSAKIVEWHADYGSGGFEDTPGCSYGGGGFTIFPYGETEVLDILDAGNNVIGFEVVQDYRMSSWGNGCNYRYDMHWEFYADGRFRTVGGAYGKGCGDNSLYKPLIRIDIAVNGDEGDSFALYDGTQWLPQEIELYRTPYPDDNGPHYSDANGYAWKVTDASGSGYYIEPDQGQFANQGRGDYAFIYAVRHHPEEGDGELPVLGWCCYDDHRQGPDEYIEHIQQPPLPAEGITNTNIVLWYVPQMLTDAYDSGDGYYCWTITGEPNPETYPCFGGPMFVPIKAPQAGFTSNSPITLTETAVFSNTTTGEEPITYTWDFGDGVGTSTEISPTYVYTAAGSYTVTLKAVNTFGQTTFAEPIVVQAEPPPPPPVYHNYAPLIAKP